MMLVLVVRARRVRRLGRVELRALSWVSMLRLLRVEGGTLLDRYGHGGGDELAVGCHARCVELAGVMNELSRANRAVLTAHWEWRVVGAASVHLRLDSSDRCWAAALH